MNERCQPFERLILNGIQQPLPATQQEILDRHLATCPDCRELRLALDHDDQRLSAFVSATDGVFARLEDRIMQDLNQAEQTPTRESTLFIRFVSSRRARLAIAAVFLAALVLGVDFLGRDPMGGLVWAEVLSRFEEAEDYICRRIEKRSGEPTRNIVEYRSAKYGLRQDIYQDGNLAVGQYIIPDDRMLYALIHRDHTYMQQQLTSEQVAEMTRQSNAAEMVKSFKDYDYSNLGRRRIDGRLAEGIEIKDPKEWIAVFESGTWELWVDVETQWPLLLRLEGVAAGGAVRKTYTLKDFQWNAELSAQDFEVDIPDDYRLIADLNPVEANEEQAIAGLRAYARLLDGRYPSTLSFATAIAEAEEFLDGRHSSYDAAAGRDLEAVFSLRSACNFFRDLDNAGQDVAYYGATVKAGDFDRVLMRWRLEDGRYRVIFGDLRITTEDGSKLEDLERGIR